MRHGQRRQEAAMRPEVAQPGDERALREAALNFDIKQLPPSRKSIFLSELQVCGS
jgi:hypothetical protein